MNKAAQALGRLGGSKTSEAKASAARKNAKRPRPNARKKSRERKRAAGVALKPCEHDGARSTTDRSQRLADENLSTTPKTQ
jgi:hypothetical protein